MNDIRLLKHNALRNALYHEGRRRVLEGYSRFCTFIVIVLGASVVSDVLAAAPSGRVAAGLLVAVVGAMQLVLDFGGRATVHAVLQKRFQLLFAEMQGESEGDMVNIAYWNAELARIYADEPPVLRARDAKAYNDAIDALDIFDGNERLVIPFWHRLLGGIVAFEGHRYPKVRELPGTSLA